MTSWLKKHLRQLIGHTIVGLLEDDEEGYYGFRTDKGALVWVLCDPEGNGPGHLDIIKKDQKHENT